MHIKELLMNSAAPRLSVANRFAAEAGTIDTDRTSVAVSVTAPRLALGLSSFDRHLEITAVRAPLAQAGAFFLITFTSGAKYFGGPYGLRWLGV
jgi:hypothetical protein